MPGSYLDSGFMNLMINYEVIQLADKNTKAPGI